MRKLTLAKYQQIDEIINRDISDLDKGLFATCVVFDMTEYELDNSGVKKAERLMTKTNKIFSRTMKGKPHNRIGIYKINHEVSKMTFGQYIELAYFLSVGYMKNAHYIMATLSKTLFKTEHPKRADYFLKQPIGNIIGSIKILLEKFRDFNAEYKSLFGLDAEVNGSDAQFNHFNKRYGWIYSASQVAEYYRIPLDDAFNLKVREAFNALAFLKAKAKYEADQIKKK